MKTSVRIAVLAVVVIAVGAIVAVKYRGHELARTKPTLAPRPAAASRPAIGQARSSVLLFANLAEAKEGDDGCGIIIRTVRSARDHGIIVTEYDSGASPEVRKQHRVVVEPTVIVFDGSGREIARHEGEDSATIAAIRADIERVSGGRA